MSSNASGLDTRRTGSLALHTETRYFHRAMAKTLLGPHDANEIGGKKPQRVSISFNDIDLARISRPDPDWFELILEGSHGRSSSPPHGDESCATGAVGRLGSPQPSADGSDDISRRESFRDQVTIQRAYHIAVAAQSLSTFRSRQLLPEPNMARNLKRQIKALGPPGNRLGSTTARSRHHQRARPSDYSDFPHEPILRSGLDEATGGADPTNARRPS
jgi:hypothetical protein